MNFEALSPREKEILDLLIEGLKNKEIAEKLYIQPNTIKTHMRNIINKTGIDSRTRLAIMYYEYVQKTNSKELPDRDSQSVR